jgi:hypothetical protein
MNNSASFDLMEKQGENLHYNTCITKHIGYADRLVLLIVDEARTSGSQDLRLNNWNDEYPIRKGMR